MTQSARSAGRRLSAITLDQVVAGGSNLLVAVLAARTLGPSGFGLFSIVFIAYVSAQGASRAMVGEPLLIHPLEAEERTGEALGSGLVLGVGFGLLLLASAALASVWSSELAWSLVVLGGCLPALVLQDQGRYLGFALQRPVLSLVLDSVWLVVMLAALGLLLVADQRSLVWFVVAWAGSGALAGLLVFPQHVARSLRSARPGLAWLRQTWSYAWRYLASFSVAQAGALGTSIGLIGVIGARGLGGVQGALLLTRPALTVQAASIAAGVTEIARSASQPGELSRHVRRTTSVTTLAALFNGTVLLLLPEPVGRLVIGKTWDVAQPLLLPVVLHLVLLTLNSGAKAGLLGQRAVGKTVWIEGLGTVAVISAAIVGGLVNGALGAMWGRTIIWVAILAVWWAVFLAHRRSLATTIAQPSERAPGADPSSIPGVH